MPNTNWLVGLACPRGGSQGPLQIDTRLTLTVTDDGPVAYDTDNAAWTPHAGCVCPACGQAGCIADFTLKTPAARRGRGPVYPEPPMPDTLIYVAVYEHKYGTDTFVCASEAEALALREDLARESWSQELPDTPLPAAAVGEAYFAALAERWGDSEYFDIHRLACDLSRFHEAGPPPTTRLYIARYEHPHGTEVFACASEAEALALREDLARENWEQEMPGTPRPASAVGEAYFAALGERWGDNEYFEIVPVDCDLTRFTEAARPPPPPEAEPEGAELAALKAQYAARGLLLFRPGDAGAPGGARWALTRTARLSGLLYRDFATFRDVDFGVRLYADQERLAVPPA